MIYVSAAVEGDVDEIVIRAILSTAGLGVSAVFGKHGKHYLRSKLSAYNKSASYQPWVVLTDLDDDEDCAPPLRHKLLPHPARQMCFRIAVREVEAWLLADRERVASFFGVARSRVPANPENERDAKQAMLQLARSSRSRAIREDMVPREGSGRLVGPAYASRLIEFAGNRRDGWRCEVAAETADSLRRCLTCLRRLGRTTTRRIK
jgi:hypothetical protein